MVSLPKSLLFYSKFKVLAWYETEPVDIQAIADGLTSAGLSKSSGTFVFGILHGGLRTRKLPRQTRLIFKPNYMMFLLVLVAEFATPIKVDLV